MSRLRKTFIVSLLFLVILMSIYTYDRESMVVIYEDTRVKDCAKQPMLKVTRDVPEVKIKNRNTNNTSNKAAGNYAGAMDDVPSSISCSVKWQIQYWGGRSLKLRDGDYFCPELDAAVRYTTKRGYDVMMRSEVIILHETGNWDPAEVARIRRNDQLLAYWSVESPTHSQRAEDLSVFNWTITYRNTSDFVIPYGRMTPFNSSRNTDRKKPKLKKNWAEGKTKLAAWVASNCHWIGFYKPSWSRLRFVQTLQKYMDIDTFGWCGKSFCFNCIEGLNKYKFYLAFENDQCEDYITEKVWRNAFLHEAVPIVFGANRSNLEKVIPKDSFIHVSDFANISSLVARIEQIDRNDSLYNKFFQWRNDFYAEFIDETDHMDEEKLCIMAAKYESSQEKYYDKTKWFHSSCYASPVPRDE